jgi:hypothetical protein
MRWMREVVLMARLSARKTGFFAHIVTSRLREESSLKSETYSYTETTSRNFRYLKHSPLIEIEEKNQRTSVKPGLNFIPYSNRLMISSRDKFPAPIVIVDQLFTARPMRLKYGTKSKFSSVKNSNREGGRTNLSNVFDVKP